MRTTKGGDFRERKGNQMERVSYQQQGRQKERETDMEGRHKEAEQKDILLCLLECLCYVLCVFSLKAFEGSVVSLITKRVD